MVEFRQLAWGKRVSWQFRKKVFKMADLLDADPDDLMACMAFETGETFSPSIRNAAGSGATGLIQFLPSTAVALSTTTDKLARMSGPQQLDYVLLYFLRVGGNLRSLSNVYMAILWPAAVGKPDDYVLFRKADKDNPKRYVQNAGLDYNKDGVITKREASARVHAALERGLRQENVAGLMVESLPQPF